MAQGWQFRVVDALIKVHPTIDPPILRAEAITGFIGEPIAFQLAIRAPLGIDRFRDAVSIEIDADSAVPDIRAVDLVPCQLVAYGDHDEGYASTSPGLYPDILRPTDGDVIEPLVWGWTAAWIELLPPPGRTSARVTVRHRASREVLFSTTLSVEVLGVGLPELDIVHSQWFHADAVADAYDVPVFSEEHWAAVDRFIGSAARMRTNSLLVPVWTPPIDTEPGEVRRPVQLVEIRVTDGRYEFDFARLDRWLGLLRRHGIARIEIPHFFTQWGAKHAPAFYGIIDGAMAPLFGWQTAATSPQYRAFLEAIVPALRRHLESVWDPDRIVFHISDEPSPEDESAYVAARQVVADLLTGARVMDALSDPRFLRSGAVEHPIIATDAFELFRAEGVRDPWVYHCLTQHREVSNRFIGLRSARQRVLGAQLFETGAEGFLHWGFNFYYTARARRFVDPFTDASAGGTMPAGDPFVVYPGPRRTPWESVRHRVAAQAMDDHRALQLVRDMAGHEVARATLHGVTPGSYRAPEVRASDIRSMRRKVESAVRAHS